jgi:hypothetical protein
VPSGCQRYEGSIHAHQPGRCNRLTIFMWAMATDRVSSTRRKVARFVQHVDCWRPCRFRLHKNLMVATPRRPFHDELEQKRERWGATNSAREVRVPARRLLHSQQ